MNSAFVGYLTIIPRARVARGIIVFGKIQLVGQKYRE